MKTAYIEPAWKLPLSAQILSSYPPQGYRFIVPKAFSQKPYRLASKMDFSYTLQSRLGKLIPLCLAKSYIEKFKSIPKTDLTYAFTHLVFRKESWVLDMKNELPYLLLGEEKYLNKYREVVKETLTSPYCKKIICGVEEGRKAFLSQIGEELEGKIEVIYGAIPPKKFVKQSHKDKVKLLMVNSANINTAEHFYNKGGKEVIEAFLALRQKYSNVELIIRSGMPGNLKRRCSQIEGIKIIDKPIPWGELEQEWKTADIFVLPNHVNTPAMVFFDAMSYELPIVTTDVWANPEIVEDGRVGSLIPKSGVAQYIDGCIMHLNSQEYKKVITTLDPKMVQALVEKTSLLIENEELRKRMGKAARWEVEHGKFSIERTKEKLKRIFDEATA